MVRMTVSAFVAFVMFVTLHFLHFHYFRPPEKVTAVLMTAGLGVVIYLLVFFLLPREERLWMYLKIRSKALLTLTVSVGLLVYGLLFIGYLEFYFTADRSITFRMLRIIDEQPAHTLTAEQMLQLYDTRAIILRRFEDLVYGGYLEKSGEQYQLTPKGQRTLGLYRFTIDYLHLGKF